MLDPKFIRENPEIVKHATLVKRLASPELVDAWLAADGTRRNSQTQFDSLRNEQKRLGELVGKLKRELKAGTSQELEKLIAEANAIKMQQDALMADLTAAESDCQTIMLQLPAIPDPSWPVGKDERENVVVRTWSDPTHSPLQLDAGRKDHVTIGKELGIIDIERGVKLAGSRSYILRGLGARLYWSVLRFAQDFLVARGYELMVVPVMVSEQCMIGTGYFPAGRDQTYITQDGSALVGTSEVPLASFYSDEIVELERPIKLCALRTKPNIFNFMKRSLRMRKPYCRHSDCPIVFQRIAPATWARGNGACMTSRPGCRAGRITERLIVEARFAIFSRVASTFAIATRPQAAKADHVFVIR